MKKLLVLSLVAGVLVAGCDQGSAAQPTVSPDQAKSQGFKAPPPTGGGASSGGNNLPKSNQATATTD